MTNSNSALTVNKAESPATLLDAAFLRLSGGTALLSSLMPDGQNYDMPPALFADALYAVLQVLEESNELFYAATHGAKPISNNKKGSNNK